MFTHCQLEWQEKNLAPQELSSFDTIEDFEITPIVPIVENETSSQMEWQSMESQPIEEYIFEDDKESSNEGVEQVGIKQTLIDIPPIPLPPIEPFILYETPYEDEISSWDFEPQEQIDWSEFVFSDEPVELPSGIYYVSLYVNEFMQGSIEMLMSDGIVSFSKTALEEILKDIVTTSYFENFFELEEEWYSLDYLQQKAQEVLYDSTNLILSLMFNSNQMPIQNLSMSSRDHKLRSQYNITGAIELEPAKFTLISNINALFNTHHSISDTFSLKTLSLSVGLSNTFSFWNMTFNIPISLMYTKNQGFSYSLGNFYGYVDFPTKNLRLSFGGVGSSNFSTGSPFGFVLEKNYNFGSSSANDNQYEKTITLEEDSLLEVTVNGKVVFRRNMAFGIYRLRDFVLSSGNNDIKVRIHPLSMGNNDSQDTILFFEQSYDSSLLAKGDNLWRAGATIQKTMRPQITFDFSNFNLFGELTLGLFHNYTQSFLLSILVQKQTPNNYLTTLKGSLSGTLATVLGTTKFNLTGTILSSGLNDSIAQLVISQSFANEKLKALSLTTSFFFGKQNEITLSVNYSFKLSPLAVSTSLKTSYSSATGFNVAAMLSMGSVLGKRVSFSLSTSIDDKFNAYASFGLSFSIGANTTSATASFTKATEPTMNVSSTMVIGKNNVTANVGNIKFSDILNHNVGMSWSHSGSLFNFATRVYTNTGYSALSTATSLSTAFVFADGKIALSNGISSPFVILSPQKSLKDIEIATSGSSSSNSNKITRTFGNALFKNLKMYEPNTVIVFASSNTVASASQSFVFKATPQAMQGFVAKIKLEPKLTISGVLLKNEYEAYSLYSSPLYKVELLDDGISIDNIRELEENYLFTDSFGRFIFNDLKAGLYMFDLEINGLWYAVFFEIPSNIVVQDTNWANVLVFADFIALEKIEETETLYDISSFDEEYCGSFMLQVQGLITEDDFWDILI